MADKPKRYYYYSLERGCLRDIGAIDAIGIGVDNGKASCSLVINLMRLRDNMHEPHYVMQAAACNDEWSVFVECRDVLELLATQGIPSGEMTSSEPFYELRSHLEKLGYENLGVLER